MNDLLRAPNCFLDALASFNQLGDVPFYDLECKIARHLLVSLAPVERNMAVLTARQTVGDVVRHVARTKRSLIDARSNHHIVTLVGQRILHLAPRIHNAASAHCMQLDVTDRHLRQIVVIDPLVCAVFVGHAFNTDSQLRPRRDEMFGFAHSVKFLSRISFRSQRCSP